MFCSPFSKDIAFAKLPAQVQQTIIDKKLRFFVIDARDLAQRVQLDAELQEARQVYESTGDIGLAHRKLQERFESFLRDVLALDDDLFAAIVRRGWGLAGIRHGDTIIATKIPKSGFLVEYMQEADPEKRRQYYCHCPRIREALRTSETISATYCYCGAGFYKGIWEEILQKPVEVEVLESVLHGDDVCRIAVHLPQAR